MEQDAGVTALASPIVIWELLSHLSDQKDSSFQNCLNSVAALGVHTKLSDREGIAIGGDAYSTLSRTLFDEIPIHSSKFIQGLAMMVSHIEKYAPDLSDATCQSNLAKLKNIMSEQDKSWLRGLKKISDEFCPEAYESIAGVEADPHIRSAARDFYSSDHFFYFWSRMTVVISAAIVGVPIENVRMNEASKFIRDSFEAPFRLIQTLYVKVLGHSPPSIDNPKKKISNFYWDSLISFNICDGTINGMPLYVITGDRAIQEAAETAGYKDRVLSLQDYKQALGVRLSELRDDLPA